MIDVPTLYEGERGCGYRKPGGLYLVGGRLSEPCPKLPIACDVCPTCHGGIKPTRGWTWVEPDPIIRPGRHGTDMHDLGCPFGVNLDTTPKQLGRAGLLWVGEKFYATPAEFTREAAELGLSRRIPAVPRDFQIGVWVLLAHRKAIPGPFVIVDDKREQEFTPGIFTAFQPTRVEYVVRGDESDEELEAMQKRGITPVRVKRQQSTLDEALEARDDAKELV